MSSREVLGSPATQGQDERIAYSIDFAAWGVTSPTGIVFAAYDKTLDYLDVTATVLAATTGSVAGSVVTLPLLVALVAGHEYRVECKVVGGGQTVEAYLRVIAER